MFFHVMKNHVNIQLFNVMKVKTPNRGKKKLSRSSRHPKIAKETLTGKKNQFRSVTKKLGKNQKEKFC